jgi:hypothetical protein
VKEKPLTKRGCRKQTGHVEFAVALVLQLGDRVEVLRVSGEIATIPPINPFPFAEGRFASMHKQAP